MFFKKKDRELTKEELEILNKLWEAEQRGEMVPIEEFGLDITDVDWKHRWAARLFPKRYSKYRVAADGVPGKWLDFAHGLFGKADRVDIFPLRGRRGFMIVLDKKFSLWFYQDGDHFVFDGFEAGKYEEGDVTVFDDVEPEKVKSPFTHDVSDLHDNLQ